MAISEKRYAVEFLNKDAAVFKFDDAGCMVNYIKRQVRRQDVLASFVVDYETRRWLRAEDAYYVRSVQIKTPMGGGIIAFADKEQAASAASRYQGQRMRFDGLF
jgi:copper chaperone NosL